MAKGADIVRNDGYDVGDVLTYDVGYTMELPHFAVVTRRTARTVVVEVLANSYEYDDRYHQTGYAMPTGHRTGQTYRCRFNRYGHVSVDGHGAHPWDGTRKRWDTMD